jgi:hypothetical protein
VKNGKKLAVLVAALCMASIVHARSHAPSIENVTVHLTVTAVPDSTADVTAIAAALGVAVYALPAEARARYIRNECGSTSHHDEAVRICTTTLARWIAMARRTKLDKSQRRTERPLHQQFAEDMPMSLNPDGIKISIRSIIEYTWGASTLMAFQRECGHTDPSGMLDAPTKICMDSLAAKIIHERGITTKPNNKGRGSK